MARKKKIREPEKLWEIPADVIQKRIEHLKQFPNSLMLKIYQAEIAREDRSQPMNIDKLLNKDYDEQDLPSGTLPDEGQPDAASTRKRRTRKSK